MRIAIPLFYSRVSPNFSYAQELLLATKQKGDDWSRETFYWGKLDPMLKIASLFQLGVNVVICGGIHGSLLHYLECKGIPVMSGVMGEAEEALRLYSEGNLAPGSICLGRLHRRRCRRGPPWLCSEESEYEES